MALDVQAKAVLEAAAKLPKPNYATLDPNTARRQYVEMRRLQQPPKPEVAASIDRSIAGSLGTIPVRLTRPLGSRPDQALPVLIYFHGGGWVIGDIDTHDTLCRILSNKSGAAVLSVGYRLAPENKFPCAVDDALAAVRWVAAEAGSLALDATRLAIGGDSAGGNIAAAVALMIRDASGPALRLQLLIYPATDFAADAPSHSLFAEGHLLTRDGIRWYTKQYLRGPEDILDWRASPLKAPDLTGVAPAFVLTAGFDPLRDEGKAYADRLSATGVPTTYRCFEGMVHGFCQMGGLIAAAHSAHDEAAAALKAAFI